MSRIVVDVTQLAHWSGHITGIPRVIDELAKRFAEQREHDVVFAVWVKDLKELCVIDFDETITKRNGVIYKKIRMDNASVGTVSVRRVARSSIIRKGLKKGLGVGMRISPVLASRFEQRIQSAHMKPYLRVDFEPGDVLFVPWGEWWDPNFTDYVVAMQQAGTKVVQVIHDIAPTVQPQFFERVDVSPETYNARVLPGCALVLAVSRNTKHELEAWLKERQLHAPRIAVFRNGDTINATKPVRPRDVSFTEAGLKGNDYILCVGTIEAKKNHALLYYVYKLARARGVKLPKLVIVGRRGWCTSDIYSIMTRDPEVMDLFVFLHDVSDSELAWLYDNCLFTVLPSFHEGWGIPIAESLARGVPCLCSNTSSMVEIAEGIVGHFSPASTDECLEAITAWLDVMELAKARTRTQQYKPTTWDGTFRQIIDHIEEIL